MSYFVKGAEAVLTIMDNKPVWFRDVNVVIEDESLKCIGKDCEKPRGSTLINGVGRVVTPSLPNPLVEPESVLTRSIVEQSLNNVTLVRELTKAICLVHLINGLMGFTSFSRINIDPGVCTDLSIKVAVVRKVDSTNFNDVMGGRYGLDLCDDKVVKEIGEILPKMLSKGRLIIIKTSINRHSVFLFKKTTGLYPLEFLYKYGAISNETLISHINWVTLGELNVLKEVKSTVVISPSSSLYFGERGFVPINHLCSINTSIALSSDLYYVNRFDLYREFQFLSLITRFLFNGLQLNYGKVFIDTFLAASKTLGYNITFEDKVWVKPSLTIHRVRKSRLINTVNDILLDIPYSKPDYVFIDGKPVLTPFNEEELLLKLNETLNALEEKSNYAGTRGG